MMKAAPDEWSLCTAPMMDWSDRHCRYYFRLLAPHARLYTEMVTTGPLIHGDAAKHAAHLDFDPAEHPLALQLGGSEPEELARSARLGARWGYDEINLNCGCPSERVQRGAFGACLMAEPRLVRDCLRAMREAVPDNVAITVKHRIGLNDNEDYGFVRDFVGTVAESGVSVFIVHARNAVLKGLSPKENREIPPLRDEVVTKLVEDFPELVFVLNGGIDDLQGAETRLAETGAQGVMLGRSAYHDSYRLAEIDAAWWGQQPPTRESVVVAMADYASRILHATRSASRPVRLRDITRHMLGLYAGQPGGKHWRRMLSDPQLLAANDPDLLFEAMPRGS